MIKRILFIFMLLCLTGFISFLILFGESAESMQSLINQAISENDYTSFLAYNDYYMETPTILVETDDYTVLGHNAYDQEIQNITLILVDHTKSTGEEASLVITCDTEKEFDIQFYNYEEALVSVYSVVKGDTEFGLPDTCTTMDVLITANDGSVMANLTDVVGFIEDGDFTTVGVAGYTDDEMMDIQYPNGFFRPLIIPIIGLWASIITIVYLYKKFFKKNSI